MTICHCWKVVYTSKSTVILVINATEIKTRHWSPLIQGFSCCWNPLEICLFEEMKFSRSCFQSCMMSLWGCSKKIGNVDLYIEKPSQVKTRALCLQRSFSVDSPRTPLINGGGSPLTLERFKVHTVVRGGGGQGSSKSK
ncbi:hypothetical protein OIU78_006160 [Salix suchowensis]|nr:hypothetical protein OIU78_006160 [Salix suchowensis]